MLGVIFSALAGAFMSIQGVFNTRLSEKAGLWETNAFVQGTGFIITIIIALIWGDGNFKMLFSTNKLYLIGGIIGAAITFTVMLGMGKLGPTAAVSIILIAQLLVAALIDAFGLFGTQKLAFGINKIIALILMIGSVILFKIK